MKAEHARHAPGDRFEAAIERIVAGGFGFARGPHGVVLVDAAAPGDRAVIEVTSLHGGVARGHIEVLLEAGPGRVEPLCPFVPACGGCDFQHLTYEAQFAAKQGIVADAFERIGGVALPKDVALYPAPRPFGARARVELHTDRATGAVGFFTRRSRTVVDIDRCVVSRAEINRAIETIRTSRQPLPRSIRLLGGDGTVRSNPALPPLEREPFWLEIGEFDYLVDPASFFQSSLDLLPELIDAVTGSVGERRGLAWDLFCGGGLFSLPLAWVFERVVGVDSDRAAIEHAISSANKNGILNAGFVADDVVRWESGRQRGSARPNLIVVDPPRAGLGEALASALAARHPDRLTYVSCDPATLARDLRTLVSSGLSIAEVAIFDLFPQTHHVETVVRLVSSEPGDPEGDSIQRGA